MLSLHLSGETDENIERVWLGYPIQVVDVSSGPQEYEADMNQIWWHV
jgi:hypothetical protein